MNLDELAEKQRIAPIILADARKAGLVTDADHVWRHLAWYRRWHAGHISLGQLMGRTGAKMRPKVTIQRKVDMTKDGTTLMVDTTHGSVDKVPADILYVCGYVSGTSDIKWTAEDWARFPKARHIRNFQGYGDLPDLHAFDEIDVESDAITPQEAASIVRTRVLAGIPWTNIYAGDANLAAVSSAIRAYGASIWNGHVTCRLADWSLSESEATAKVGTQIHGMTCMGVQWASPTSNPNTLLPGTKLTLREANCDLSVVDATWIPSGGWGVAKPVTGPPAPALQQAVLVILPTGAPRKVASTDGGVTWH